MFLDSIISFFEFFGYTESNFDAKGEINDLKKRMKMVEEQNEILRSRIEFLEKSVMQPWETTDKTPYVDCGISDEIKKYGNLSDSKRYYDFDYTKGFDYSAVDEVD